MARTEGTFSERVGARISPELKESVRELVSAGVFDSEADAVREALWLYVEQSAGSHPIERSAPPQADSAPADAAAPPADSSHLEWLTSALFVLIALVGSRILKALGQPAVIPADLADEAIQETIYNHHILRKKLAAAREIAQELEAQGEQKSAE
jgi:Arc/MetJ-type ribon-helix-helix transcriptional regulator